MLTIDDSAFPPVPVVLFQDIAVGSVYRKDNHYMRKLNTSQAYSLSTNSQVSAHGSEVVQPVTATLIITAP